MSARESRRRQRAEARAARVNYPYPPPARPLKEFKPHPYVGPTSNVPEPKPRNPADYTHEENIAFFHEQTRLEAERQAREAAKIAAFFEDNDREEEDPGADSPGYYC
mgnify:CR=1 FL=1